MAQGIEVDLESDAAAPLALGLSITSVVILLAHVVVDFYAALVPSILGIIEVRYGLLPQQAAWLLGLGVLSSGLAQPVFALVSDRLNSRIFAALGLSMAAVLMASLGWMRGPGTLFACYMLGMIGVGMFHPIAASTMGHLNPTRRSSAISAFFVAGMSGGVLGSVLAPRLVGIPSGFAMLPWIALPGLILAVVLNSKIGRRPHGKSDRSSRPTNGSSGGQRWLMIGLLYIASAFRFLVNTALVYLYLRWSQGNVQSEHPTWSAEQIASASAPIIGNLNACTIGGMAIGGIASGLLVRAGHEKWPLVLVPIGFAPGIAIFPHVQLPLAYAVSILAGIGFASMIPVTIALAQRLLPNRTNLASGLMMGGAWTVAMCGPRLADWAQEQFGLPVTFMIVGVALALSGIVTLPITSASIQTVTSDCMAVQNDARAISIKGTTRCK